MLLPSTVRIGQLLVSSWLVVVDAASAQATTRRWMLREVSLTPSRQLGVYDG